MSDVAEGHCRCGRIQMSVKGAALVTMACHYTGCQQMTASAFSMSALFSSVQFKATAGQPVFGGLHGATRHFFCGWCMSWLFTKPEAMDGVVNVRSTLFDALADGPPFIETWTTEKRSWVATGAKHSFAALPEPSAFSQLIDAFTKDRGGQP